MKNSSSFRRAVGADSVPNRLVATLPFVPHPQQCWMAEMREIDDPDVSLTGVLPVQVPSVLL